VRGLLVLFMSEKDVKKETYWAGLLLWAGDYDAISLCRWVKNMILD
jgi:hypothetical protein